MRKINYKLVSLNLERELFQKHCRMAVLKEFLSHFNQEKQVTVSIYQKLKTYENDNVYVFPSQVLNPLNIKQVKKKLIKLVASKPLFKAWVVPNGIDVKLKSVVFKFINKQKEIPFFLCIELFGKKSHSFGVWYDKTNSKMKLLLETLIINWSKPLEGLANNFEEYFTQVSVSILEKK